MNHFPTISVLLAAGLVSACASNPVYEGRYPWDAGWREGVVGRVGQDDDLRRRHAYRCPGEASNSTAVRFAAVRWVQTGKARSQTVAIANDSTLKVGELVYVNVFDCARQLQLRALPKRSSGAQNRTPPRLDAKAGELAHVRPPLAD